MTRSIRFVLALALVVALAPLASTGAPKSEVCAACVKASMDRLAGDDLKGRKCGSGDENAAARYLADTLRREGIPGGLPGGGYLQAVQLVTPTFSAPPTLELSAGGNVLALTQGREMVAIGAPVALSAPVVRVTDVLAPTEGLKGKVVIWDPTVSTAGGTAALKAGAAAVILKASEPLLSHWTEMAERPPARTEVVGGVERPAASAATLIYVKADTLAALARFTGGEARLSAPRGPAVTRTTYNVIGLRHGRAKDADQHAVMLTAHYDHLGVRGGSIFHGANDDASGTAAVMEFARILGGGKPHRRTVYFALFGCEEEGGLGAQYFLAHTPGAVSDIAANLEFEMIGVDDPKQPGALMLTGWDRSNLGPTLKAHGAKIGPDPYPEQNFFQRSDNYQLALRGVVAQTVSAWPVPPTYHSAADDLAHVDLAFMDSVIGSLVAPVTWLLDSDFQPAWNPGGKP